MMCLSPVPPSMNMQATVNCVLLNMEYHAILNHLLGLDDEIC